MILLPKKRKEIVLLHFTLWFLNKSQEFDLETIKENKDLNKKTEKEIKHLLAHRNKIISKTKKYFNELNKKLLRKQKVQIDKQFNKLKSSFLHKMNLFEKIKKKNGIDEIYVEFDYISYLLIKLMIKENFDFFDNEDLKNSKMLIDSYLSGYKKMSQKEKELIENFIKSLVFSFTDS